MFTQMIVVLITSNFRIYQLKEKFWKNRTENKAKFNCSFLPGCVGARAGSHMFWKRIPVETILPLIFLMLAWTP